VGRNRVEQRQHGFLARVGYVHAGKARRARGAEQIGERAAGQPVQVHQMVVAADAGRRERILVQDRGQGLLDVGADEADERAFHAAASGAAAERTRHRWLPSRIARPDHGRPMNIASLSRSRGRE
jgi:hypothetical protein